MAELVVRDGPACCPYTLLGATVSQDIGAGVAAFARIENITDVVYISERLEGIFTGLPRRFSVGLEYTH